MRGNRLRANLGVGWTRIDPASWSIGLTAGRQVFHSRVDPGFDGGAGGAQTFRTGCWRRIIPGSNGLAIANRALFDDSLSISRNELRLGWYRAGITGFGRVSLV